MPRLLTARRALAAAPPIVVGSLLFAGGTSSGDSGGDRVNIPRFNGEACNVGAGEFTIELWIRPSATASDNNESAATAGANYSAVFGNLFWDSDRFETGRAFVIGLDSGRVCFGVLNASSSGQTAIGVADLRDGNWHHIAVYRDATSGLMEIFVDGDREASVTGPTGDISHPGGTGGAANDRYHCIGNEKAAVGFGFAGSISEVRISTNRRYNGLTYTQPTAPFTSDADTVWLAHFNENTGTNVNDESSEGIDGTIVVGGGGPTWSTADPFGGS